LIKYCDENCEQLGDWTECQEGQSVVEHMDCVEAGDQKKFVCGNRTFGLLILLSHQCQKQKDFQSVLIHPAKYFEVYFFKFVRHV